MSVKMKILLTVFGMGMVAVVVAVVGVSGMMRAGDDARQIADATKHAANIAEMNRIVHQHAEVLRRAAVNRNMDIERYNHFAHVELGGTRTGMSNAFAFYHPGNHSTTRNTDAMEETIRQLPEIMALWDDYLKTTTEFVETVARDALKNANAAQSMRETTSELRSVANNLANLADRTKEGGDETVRQWAERLPGARADVGILLASLSEIVAAQRDDEIKRPLEEAKQRLSAITDVVRAGNGLFGESTTASDSVRQANFRIDIAGERMAQLVELKSATVDSREKQEYRANVMAPPNELFRRLILLEGSAKRDLNEMTYMAERLRGTTIAVIVLVAVIGLATWSGIAFVVASAIGNTNTIANAVGAPLSPDADTTALAMAEIRASADRISHIARSIEKGG